MKDLPLILTHGEFTKHITLTPSPPTVLEAPVTEVIILYFAPEILQAGKDAATARLNQYLEKSVKTWPDVKGVTSGWGVENDFPVRGGDEGQVGTILTAFVGWPSIDAHEEFRKTEGFKEGFGVLSATEGLAKLVTFHLSCRVIERTSG